MSTRPRPEGRKLNRKLASALRIQTVSDCHSPVKIFLRGCLERFRLIKVVMTRPRLQFTN